MTDGFLIQWNAEQLMGKLAPIATDAQLIAASGPPPPPRVYSPL